MMHNDNLSQTQQGQVALSYELLCLLHWLVEHEAESIKSIIKKAVSTGLKKELHTVDSAREHLTSDDMQQSIIAFFGLLEILLVESINEHITQQAQEKNLIPAVDQIDSTLCDVDTVRSSLEQTTDKIELNPNTNAREQLFKELLKCWKPHNKNIVH